MEKQDSESSCNTNINFTVSDSTSKLQFRKDVSKGRWDAELRMAEIVEKKGGMWTTTGIIRASKLYCSIEETLFLVEIGALLLLDANDTILSFRNIYEMIAEEENGCSWEYFKAYRHLKSLGYIVARHGIPWSLKNVTQQKPEINRISDDNQKENALINNLLRGLQINELKPMFDVYLPNSKFKKSSTGDPDYVLCIARDPPLKAEIEDLERRCNGIPVKICNVDHGLVSFFSFNNIELPVLP